MIRRTPDEAKKTHWFVVSFVTALLVGMSSAGLIEEEVIAPRTLDGTLLELGRYALFYDAMDYLNEQPDAVVVGIGSSKLREGFDGALLAKESAAVGVTFANLAVAGDVPF